MTDYEGMAFDEETEWDWPEYLDGATGEALDNDLVKKAMEEELAEYDRFEVYEEVDDEKCWRHTGERPISTRWRIVNKGDRESPDIRARLIAQQVKRKGWASIFAATPPLWAFRALCSIMQTKTSSRVELKMIIIDLRRAFLHSKASGETYVKPPHLKGTDRCWRALKSIYGTLPAAQEFQDSLNAVLVKEMGMMQGECHPCLFYANGSEYIISLAYHGDDICCVGTHKDLLIFHEKLSKHFDAKVKYLIGSGEKDDKHGVILNRFITLQDGILHWESDPRHHELIIAELGLLKAKSVSTPAARFTKKDVEQCEELTGTAIKQYRSTAARAGFLSMDRWELLYSAKECLRGMSKPTTLHLRMLKRIGRYLIGEPRVVLMFERQSEIKHIDAVGDTDHNGCVISRKSTNGGAIWCGSHAVTAWSTTQNSTNLAVGESEWYGALKTSAEGLTFQAGMKSLGSNLELRIGTDSTSCVGTGHRLGSGQLKHVEARYLWLQQCIRAKRLVLYYLRGEDNATDLMTKPLSAPVIRKHMKSLQLRAIQNGRHKLAPKLTVDVADIARASPLVAYASQQRGEE